jgi:hypothetical protein
MAQFVLYGGTSIVCNHKPPSKGGSHQAQARHIACTSLPGAFSHARRANWNLANSCAIPVRKRGPAGTRSCRISVLATSSTPVTVDAGTDAAAGADNVLQDVVVVGGGISGLCTAMVNDHASQ